MLVDFVAGCVGGAAGVLAGHPFDTVKVRLQTQHDGRYRGTFHCFYSIVKRESPAGLYKGMSSPLCGLAFVNALLFGVYGNTLQFLPDPTSIRSHFFAGSLAGLTQCVVASPMELVKLRVQVQRADGGAQYRSPLDCLRKTFASSGVRGLYRGFGMTVLRDTPAVGLYFASYEWLVRRFSHDGTADGLTSAQLLSAGGLSGMLSWLFNYPADVIKSRLQADGCPHSRQLYSGAWDCIKQTYAEGGVRCFFRGLGSTLLRAFPTNAATFFTVEWTFRVVGSNGYLQRYLKMSEMEADQYHHHLDDWNQLFPLPEAGTTLIDPMLHGSRFV